MLFTRIINTTFSLHQLIKFLPKLQKRVQYSQITNTLSPYYECQFTIVLLDRNATKNVKLNCTLRHGVQFRERQVGALRTFAVRFAWSPFVFRSPYPIRDVIYPLSLCGWIWTSNWYRAFWIRGCLNSPCSWMQRCIPVRDVGKVHFCFKNLIFCGSSGAFMGSICYSF